MNKFSLILDIGAVLLILGVFLAGYNLFLTLMEVVMRVWRLTSNLRKVIWSRWLWLAIMSTRPAWIGKLAAASTATWRS